MADENTAGEGQVIDFDLERDPEARARLIDELMAPPPKGLPAIMVFGDEAVFAINPARHRRE
ncbi:MAG: hypothetical protein ACOY5Y_02845 [Pseudomonadota bacterium]